MKRWILFILFLPVICNAQSINVAGSPPIGLAPSGGSSQWTLDGTEITPTTATSTVAGYTSNVTTGVFQFGTQTSEGMRYSPVTGGGRLGIGTTAPAAPLDVSPTGGETSTATIFSGVSKFANGSESVPSITFASDPDLGFYRRASNDLGIVTGNAGAFFSLDTSRFANNSGGARLSFGAVCTPTFPVFNQAFDTDTGLGFTGQSNSDTLYLIAGGETIYTGTTTSTSIGNTYSVSVDATNHALAIDQYGQVGKDPCTVEAKADLGAITDEQAAALFDQLRPFIGEYKKREPVFETKIETDEKGIEKPVQIQTGWKYIEEGSGVVEPMMYESEMPVLNGKRLPYKDRVLIAIMAAKIRAMEKTQADILKRLEALEAK